MTEGCGVVCTLRDRHLVGERGRGLVRRWETQQCAAAGKAVDGGGAHTRCERPFAEKVAEDGERMGECRMERKPG